VERLGEDYSDLPCGMNETPKRVVKMFQELTRGYQCNISELLKTFDGVKYGGMVIVRNHKFVSLCEHHLVMFEGYATVGYLPKGEKVTGLSKLARLVDAFAYRFQVQERMTEQIADALEEHLEPKGVGVVVTARHLCMCGRGVDSPEAETITSTFRGILLDDISARSEFLTLSQHRNGI
jgi:GTP cyclohydrolase I